MGPIYSLHSVNQKSIDAINDPNARLLEVYELYFGKAVTGIKIKLLDDPMM